MFGIDTMRLTFLTWVSGVICTAFALAVGLSHVRLVTDAENRAAQMISARLSDMMELLVHSDIYLGLMQEMADTAALERTRGLAEIIRLNPATLEDDETLQGLCNDLGASQLLVTDAEGKVVHALPKQLVGTDIGSLEDGERMRQCITQPGLEVCAHAADMFSVGDAVQYTAVHRQDAPGAVVVGVRVQREQALRVVSSFASLTKNYDLGLNGYIVAFKDGALLGDEIPPFPTADLMSQPLNKVERKRLGDSEYYVYSIQKEGYRLVGAMAARELSRGSWRNLRPILMSNGVLFVLIIVVVLCLLERMVIRNVTRMGVVLRRIAQGSVEVRVDAAGMPAELRKLALGVNEMVDALQSMSVKNDEAAALELEQARAVQSTILPHDTPSFPHRREFDISGLSRRPNGVGGGVFDYFMPGEDMLCFVVAESTGRGTPAALFVTHALALMRREAAGGAEPGEVLARVNAELSDGGFGGLYLSALYGCLRVSTGELRCAAAGLAYALLQRRGGSYTRLEMPPAPVLGQSASVTYGTASFHLETADRLFVYTEGFIEAEDAEHVPFGEARLLEALGGAAAGVSDVLRRVNQMHRRFTRDAESRADVALLSLEYMGRRRERADISLNPAEPTVALDFIAERLESVFAAPVAIGNLQQAVSRVLGALPAEERVDLALDYDEDRATAILRCPALNADFLPKLGHMPVESAAYVPAPDGNGSITFRISLS